MISRRAIWVLVALAAAPLAADVNRIVLRVNDRIATLYEYDRRRMARIEEIRAAEMPQQRREQLLADAGEQTMREIYEELLVLSRADQLEIRVTEGEISSAVEEAKQSFNLATDEQLVAALAGSGLTLEEFRRQLQKNLLIREVMGREVQQRIDVEEEDARRYYRNRPEEFVRPRRMRIRDVVIGPSAADPAAVAEAIRGAVEAGEGLEEASASYREAGEAGDLVELGWVTPGDLEPALEEAIWELEAGELSAPIDARGGLHLVEVLEVEPERTLEFSEVQSAIISKLRQERFQEQMADFFTELERSSYVVANPPPEAAGFRAAIAPTVEQELGTVPPPAAPEPAPSASEG